MLRFSTCHSAIRCGRIGQSDLIGTVGLHKRREVTVSSQDHGPIKDSCIFRKDCSLDFVLAMPRTCFQARVVVSCRRTCIFTL